MATPPPPRHGPFGDRAFRFALRGCGVLVVVGTALILLTGGAVEAVGVNLVVLGGLGGLIGGGGLLLERRQAARDAGPPEMGG
jgi:hypothetical protein